MKGFDFTNFSNSYEVRMGLIYQFVKLRKITLIHSVCGNYGNLLSRKGGHSLNFGVFPPMAPWQGANSKKFLNKKAWSEWDPIWGLLGEV